MLSGAASVPAGLHCVGC